METTLIKPLFYCSLAFLLASCASMKSKSDIFGEEPEPVEGVLTQPREGPSTRDSLIRVLRYQDSLLQAHPWQFQSPDSNLYRVWIELDSLKRHLVTGLGGSSPESKVNPFESLSLTCAPHHDSRNFDKWMRCVKEKAREKDPLPALVELQPLLRQQLPPELLVSALTLYGELLEKHGEVKTSKAVKRRLEKYAEVFQSKAPEEGSARLDPYDNSLDSRTQKELEGLLTSFERGDRYPVISQLSLELLPKIKDPEIRRSVKQLVSDSWERDEKALQFALDEIRMEWHSGTDQQMLASKVSELEMAYRHLGTEPFDSLRAVLETPAAGDLLTANASPDSVYKRSEALIHNGEFTQAAALLRTLEGTALASLAKERLEGAGNQFCNNKRENASNFFKKYHNTKDPNKQREWLLKAGRELEECLSAFPDLPISKKVKKNQSLIQNKLEILENQSD